MLCSIATSLNTKKPNYPSEALQNNGAEPRQGLLARSGLTSLARKLESTLVPNHLETSFLSKIPKSLSDVKQMMPSVKVR